MARAYEVIGDAVSKKKINRRPRMNYYYFCLHCHEQVDLDPDRDEKACPNRGSNAVKTISEIVDEPCPVCEDRNRRE